ncbi:MAG: gamma-glutamylcyclotransferase family protein [Oleiphilaceae bacterium]|nr:gamma-glutamylcyclotransferase family protein [Oleiphilaceae bacterium]
MLCFAYGSNLSLRRLQARLPSARCVAVACLEEHRLVFHKCSERDRSAKCDAWYSGNPRDRVWGMVAEIADKEKPRLDAIEGLGRGYEQKQVIVTTREGEALEAQMYYATAIDDHLRPFDWYKQHVLVGAREHGLPEDYVAGIESVPAMEDPNPRRRKRELSIYP